MPSEVKLPAAVAELDLGAKPRFASKRARAWISLLLGPLAAAGQGCWIWFWVATWIELVGLSTIAYAVSQRDGGVVAAGGVVFAGARLFGVWRARRSEEPVLLVRVAGGCLILAIVWGLTLARVAGWSAIDKLWSFPENRHVIDTATAAIESSIGAVTRTCAPFFGDIIRAIDRTLNLIDIALVGTPWPLVFAMVGIVAWRLGGRGNALFALAAMLYLGLFGFWDRSMTTLSMVAVSVLLCALVGLPLGIAAGKSRALAAGLNPFLDTMQTMPSFVYLIPAVAFFSIGRPPGVIATVIFALPPMVRLTALGIRQVPEQMREAALAFGATPLQLMLQVELPLALPSILAGLNQAIMTSLSMVVVAALIGGGGLGTDVIRSLRNLETGNGILVGFAIVACAIVLDRVTQGKRSRS